MGLGWGGENAGKPGVRSFEDIVFWLVSKGIQQKNSQFVCSPNLRRTLVGFEKSVGPFQHGFSMVG